MAFKTYNPALVTISFKGINLTGIMDGTFLEAERDEDAFMKHVGAAGDVTRTRNLNKGGKVTVTLVATHPTNDLLAAILDADEQFGLGYGPLQIKDLSGNMKCRANEAWISKPPKIERAKESGSCVWVFDCAELEIFAGGNVI
ncbi:MAG: phage structural protein [Kofleriaceae bacterium]